MFDPAHIDTTRIVLVALLGAIALFELIVWLRRR